MKDDGLYCYHILEAIDRIRSYTSAGPDAKTLKQRHSRRQRAFSAIRALTSFLTRVAGKGLPGWKRTVPLLVS